jgi:alpha-tubulin suppressor-like RCC1 family protein
MHPLGLFTALLALPLGVLPSAPVSAAFSGPSSGWIGAGRISTCGIRPDATLACWGSNWFGQTDPPTGSFAAVSAGGNHACGLRTDHRLVCWGWNLFGQASSPAEVFGPLPARET